MNAIARVAGLTEASFVEEHLVANKPVIVTDVMDGWRAVSAWGPACLRDKFGEMEVQVYDDLFTLVDVVSLGDYLDRNFGLPEGTPAREYVRAYVRFKDVDFTWADHLFEALAPDWGHPYFFPRDDFVLPGAPRGKTISPVADLFPYKGLFISGRGARTRLHRDPFGTEAMLCQFHGSKRVVFYEPGLADALMADGDYVDPMDVDHRRFPRFSALRPAFDDVLHPGETLFIPGGWFHDVQTLSDSISITWNFVHGRRADPYRQAVADPGNTFDRDILVYLGGL